MKFWGQHLLIDAKSCDKKLISNKHHITKFVNQLLCEIEMVPLAPLWIEYCETHDPAKVGISFVQVLEDSHTSAHFCDVTGDSYFDCFSCKEYDSSIVTKLFDTYFKPKYYTYKVVYRDAELEPLTW